MWRGCSTQWHQAAVRAPPAHCHCRCRCHQQRRPGQPHQRCHPHQLPLQRRHRVRRRRHVTRRCEHAWRQQRRPRAHPGCSCWPPPAHPLPPLQRSHHRRMVRRPCERACGEPATTLAATTQTPGGLVWHCHPPCRRWPPPLLQRMGPGQAARRLPCPLPPPRLRRPGVPHHAVQQPPPPPLLPLQQQQRQLWQPPRRPGTVPCAPPCCCVRLVNRCRASRRHHPPRLPPHGTTQRRGRPPHWAARQPAGWRRR